MVGRQLSTLEAAGGPVRTYTPSFHRDGWFVGGGVENNLNIFGISAPGWFMKTEYRSAYYDAHNLPETFVAGAAECRRHYLQALGADHQHLAGLSLQLDRPGRREVLISAEHFSNSKAPASSGAFLCVEGGFVGPEAERLLLPR